MSFWCNGVSQWRATFDGMTVAKVAHSDRYLPHISVARCKGQLSQPAAGRTD
jgi:hypothetical protein